jgi:hypothetical protein
MAGEDQPEGPKYVSKVRMSASVARSAWPAYRPSLNLSIGGSIEISTELRFA